MHEMSVAMSVVDIAVERMKQAGATRVVSVKAAVGALSGVEPAAVEFCFQAACRGTQAEGSALVIERIEARAVCRECSLEYAPSDPLAVCPSCGAFGGRIVAGEELYVDEIAVE